MHSMMHPCLTLAKDVGSRPQRAPGTQPLLALRQSGGAWPRLVSIQQGTLREQLLLNVSLWW